MTTYTLPNGVACSRREFLRQGLYGIGISAGLPVFLSSASSALANQGDRERHPDRILVVVELTGGNDGLNTVVPNQDAYYRARPTIGIPRAQTLRINDDFGFHPRLSGFQRLYNDGKMAIVHGCGYPNPNLSHFTAMEYWHTGVPNGADARGWLGRFADAKIPEARRDYLVNIAKEQTLAVRSQVHAPLVFNDPEAFVRNVTPEQQTTLAAINQNRPTTNPSLSLLRRVSQNAAVSSTAVRDACASYRTPADYGARGGLSTISTDLIKVAALINARMPTRIYYASYSGFDTHANQAASHQLLTIYLGDAIRGFIDDMARIGRADDVVVMMFTEFGRRVQENASRGTDHGTAGPMFAFGRPVRGGLLGRHPSLTDLDAGNLRMTTDFRSVYATMIKDWMGYDDTRAILRGEFPTLRMIA